MRKKILSSVVLLASAAAIGAGPAFAQMLPGGGQGMPGRGAPIGAGTGEEAPSAVSTEKPEAAARKAYNAGMKSLNKAKGYDEAADRSSDPDKKGALLEKANDAYDKALDQFTEAVSNKGDMVEAWNHVGYIHLRLGAYAESVDDYNHTLTLKPDLLEAVEHRAEAYLHVDRLDDAKSAYMDLFNHDRALADSLMTKMQAWLSDHRTDARGMRAADVDAFDKWLQEREGIAKQTASR